MVPLRLIVCGRLILAVLCVVVVVVVTAGGVVVVFVVVVTAGGVVLRVAGGVVVVVASPWSFSSLKVFNVANAQPGPLRTAAAHTRRMSSAGLHPQASLSL